MKTQWQASLEPQPNPRTADTVAPTQPHEPGSDASRDGDRNSGADERTVRDRGESPGQPGDSRDEREPGTQGS